MDSREIATQIISHLGGLGKLRAMVDGCYNDMLKQLFEGQTGLYLSL